MDLETTVGGGEVKISRNPTMGELVYTNHPSLPIMLLDEESRLGYQHTTRIFPRGNHAIVSQVRSHMGKLIFTDGTTGWCNLCLLEVIS